MNYSASAAKTPTVGLRLITFTHALAFVFGFSLVLIVGFGGTATIFGALFKQYRTIIGQIGGAVVILFGLATLGILKLPWLYYDTRPQWKPNRRSSLVSSVVMGVFFAAGWTPCIGTTLGAILTLGFSQQTVGQAMILSSGYAFGLAIPFLVIGLMMDRAFTVTHRIRRYQRPMQIFSGIFLIFIGVMLVTRSMNIIASWALQHGYYFDLPIGSAAAPSYLIAVVAGLISFLSPCVLPLVPAYIGYLSGQSINNK